MKISRWIWIVPALALAAPGEGSIDAARYKETVHKLADLKMKGRAAGSPELEKAAHYIAGEFRKAKLQPLAGGWYQRFEVTTDARLGAANTLAVRRAASATPLKLEQDFVPLNFSSSGPVTGPVVFVGYGITAPEYHYDDYAGLDVKDKVVIVLRSEPQENDPHSVFQGKVFTSHSTLDLKAVNAKMHGAKAVLFVNHNLAEAANVPKFSRHVSGGERGLPFVQVAAARINEWLKPSGRDLDSLMKSIDKDVKPQSFEIPGVTVEGAVEVKRTTSGTPNVVGYLAGETDEYVILGAHFDHLGLAYMPGSTDMNGTGKIHPGADDNASGTAGLLELARAIGPDWKKHRRGILFLAFSAEELGLLGSSYYVNHPGKPLEKAVAMINMDMIGRIKDGRVFIGGSGTGTGLKALVDETMTSHPLKIDLSEQGGYGSSDHMSFTLKQVPVLFFFSGLHSDYHKPTDTWDKIEAGPATELLKMVYEITERLTGDTPRPAYVRVERPAMPQAAPGGGQGGYGPDFGSIPDFAEVPGGFRIADVRPGGPAAKAGVQGGDVMFEFDGKPVANLMDFSYLLRSKKPGDTVNVKLRRKDQVIVLDVTLGSRAR